jgi:hypothetical protein
MKVSGQTHVLATLSPGKSIRYPVNRRACGPQSQSECRDEENIPVSNANRNPAIQSVDAHFTDSVPDHL